MIIIINILAPYEAILSFEKITWKHGKIKMCVMKMMNENEYWWSTAAVILVC